MSDDDPVRAWLEDLGDSDDPAEAIHLTMDHAPALLSTPGVASALISDRDEAWCGRLALYWLLDAATEMRLAAAGGLRERARRGSLDPAAALPLPQIRTWIPADGARSLLDTALREARRRELVGPLERLTLQPVRLIGTLSDGSGGQSFAGALKDDDGPAAALVLIKTGQGGERRLPGVG